MSELIKPRVLVFSTLFPHAGQPNAGVFVRERMFRVGRILPLVVVAPVPWFPCQGLIRRWRPHFRPPAPRHELQQGIEVYHPRFFSIPGLLKQYDGFFMAICCLPLMRRLKRQFGFDIIDAHFAYPDGYAATWLGKWLRTPVTITLRGTEVPLSRTARRPMIVAAIERAARVFAVADFLKRHVVSLGAPADRIRVVGNGIDTEKFYPLDRQQVRTQLGLSEDAQVLISVGGLVERKGFHRVIDCLPELRKQFPRLCYLIVGGSSAEGDWGDRLKAQVKALGLEDCVRFLGALPADQLKQPLSAADVFVLATANEGWANVFLEAMACGLPVVTTDVGGNPEVVANADVGLLVPYNDPESLRRAIAEALARPWCRDRIIAYAQSNSWDSRVAVLVDEFTVLNDGNRRVNP